jgi:peptidyl-prolyl cis-trans isomerase D
MLSLMRRKAGSWMIKVILGVIVIVFVFWGVGSFRDRAPNSIASVNGTAIVYEEYRDVYSNLLEQFRRSFGNNLDEELIKTLGLRRRALEQLIDQKLLLAEAGRLSLHVSDEELVATIQDYPAFKRNGTFDSRLYRNLLASNRLTPEIFEESQRQTLLLEKLRTLIEGGVKVSETEARQWYDWNNATVNIAYVRFDPAAYEEIDLSQEEIEAYYTENKTAYKVPPQRKVAYLRFGVESYRDQVTVTDEAIEDYYQSRTDAYETPKTVEARHILFRLEPDADENTVETARQNALEVLKLAREGEDFAELAKTYSEGPSKERGGQLGAFKKEDMVAPFSEAAFAMSPGEISEPVRTRFGWHLIKVENVNDAAVRSLEEVREEIRSKLVGDAAKNLAYDAAETLYELSFEGETLEGLAASRQMELKTTSFFGRAEPPRDLPSATEFAEAAFALDEEEISEVQDFGDAYYLLQVVEERPAAIPELSEVEENVRTDLRAEKQDQKAKAEAEAFIETVGDMTLQAAARQADLPVVLSGFFKRNDPIQDLGYEPRIAEEAFSLTPDNPLGQRPVKGNKGYYVIGLKERKAPPEDGFTDEEKTIRDRLRQQKQSTRYQALLTGLKADSEITIAEGFLE